ncbi:MAG: hypothetical protein IKT34_01035 [Clostridia bacterium]|nr:hypothetical protein [Clostridia bacterium]
MHNSDELRLFFEKAKSGTNSHAYIVDGAAGIGKLDFALECARAMLCTEPNKPCGYCQSCRKVKSNDHPDIYIIGRDKTAAIADVREIIRRSSLKPNDSDKQIFIVCNAGKLREDSQNALLKLFEEPPETVAIFLLTESRSSLLPTVLSRGQRIHLDGLRDEEIASILQDKHKDCGRLEIRDAVDVASGNLGEAERYLSKENRALRVKAESLLLLALEKQKYELMGFLLVTKYKREQLLDLLNEFVAIVNEASKSRYDLRDVRKPISPELAEAVKNASRRALVRMAEAAAVCIMSLQNNANITAVSSKLAIDLLSAASR